MLYQVRKALPKGWIELVAQPLGRAGVSPNAISILGFLVNLGAGAVLALGFLGAGGILILVGGAFDLLDGALARATHRASAFGALLDSTLDRLSEGAVFFGLLIFFGSGGAIIETSLVFVALIGSFLISYIRARAEGLGLECEVGLLTRPERVIILALGLILNQVLIALWILAIFTHFTALQRLLYIWTKTSGKS